MIAIYHSRDLDGYSSVAIVKKRYEQFNDYPDNVGKGEIFLVGFLALVEVPLVVDEVFAGFEHGGIEAFAVGGHEGGHGGGGIVHREAAVIDAAIGFLLGEEPGEAFFDGFGKG